MRHVVIIGASGQLGTDLQAVLGAFRVSPLTHADIDVCETEKARQTLTDLRPDVVINTSAYHQVDQCEDEAAMSFAVNATAPCQLARLARELDYTLLHFSTDYVFDGRSVRPYAEDARPAPLSVYGTSKAAGEQLVPAYCRRHYVIRTTGLYGVAGASGKGGNFVETMIRLGRSGKPLRVVHDQVMTPTATADLAGAVATLLDREGDVPYGLYHITNADQCSWHDFAKTIFELCAIPADLSPVSSADFGAKAARPAYSVLGHDRWTGAGLAELRPWREALVDYLGDKGHLAS